MYIYIYKYLHSKLGMYYNMSLFARITRPSILKHEYMIYILISNSARSPKPPKDFQMYLNVTM